MFVQIEYGKELQFLAYLVPVIMGIQLSIYFYTHYKKLKDEDLPLNIILLAFGSFILFIVIGPLFIQIARNFIVNESVYEIVYRIGWALTFFSTIVFSRFIILKEFSLIINLKVAKTLLILNCIPVFCVFILPSLQSPIFIGSIFFVVLNGLYIIRFQIILIQKSIGRVRAKIRFFLFGALISLVALVFATIVGLRVLPPIINEIMYFIGVLDLFIGFLIIYFSVYNFPPLYEFEWRDNLIKLFIFNPNNFKTLYHLDLVQNSHSNNYSENIDRIFSKGISGIEKIIALITNTKTERINKIQQEDFLIMFEYGNTPFSLIYALIVKKDLNSSKHLLKIVRIQFESFFKEIILNLDNIEEDQESIFTSFNDMMEEILQG
ncbi:MAG: hypothetical protein KGD68_01250 [Candidatus Lokiarchaeota archaeon]|nr:hypothetical protein [Candidatus Lokiarchaeota archaeon]